MVNSVIITWPTPCKTSEGKREKLKIFVCSSMSLPHLRIFMKSNRKMTDMGRRRKLAAVAYFKALPRHLSGGPEKTQKPTISSLAVDSNAN
jgi:hypothetical protein